MSQSQKDKYVMMPFVWNICNKQIYKDRKYSRCHQGWGEERMESYFLRGTEFWFKKMKSSTNEKQ